MRFHVLGLPHTQTNKEFTACAYTQKAWKFCKMMKDRGHYVIHYGHEFSDPPADENVTVITDKKWKEVYGEHDYKSKLFTYNVNDDAYQEFYRNAIEEIGKRKQPNDFILPFWGAAMRPICDAHPDVICVEPGIGYPSGQWAQWKIFESYAIYHAYCGMGAVGNCQQSWYDVVIPNYFDLDEFEYSEDKEDYFLYLGRVYDGKGVNIAIQVTEKLGVKLKIAGQIDESAQYGHRTFPEHVEYVGYADEEKRKQLMKNARGSFLASQYLEPFGGVQIENLLCGTPTITTDWGAFAENNIQGVTGYRCRSFEEFVDAAKNVWDGKISYKACREHGEKFALHNIAPKYEDFFQKVLDPYETSEGWYRIHKPKVAIWGDHSWALGRIYKDLKLYLASDYNVEHLPYSANSIKENWEKYDLIIGSDDLTYVWGDDIPEGFLEKCLPIRHSAITNEQEHFGSVFNSAPFLYGITPEVCSLVEEKTQTKCGLLPIGVNTKEFRPFKQVTQISHLGFVGLSDSQNPSYDKVKRPEMFREIWNRTDVPFSSFIEGESMFKGKDLYQDVDMVVCTSTSETGPLALLECAASKIPFISPNVGLAKQFSSIKTFETVEEAVEIINNFNSNPESLQNYIEEVYKEITTSRDWENVVNKYWLPELKNRLDGIE